MPVDRYRRFDEFRVPVYNWHHHSWWMNVAGHLLVQAPANGQSWAQAEIAPGVKRAPIVSYDSGPPPPLWQPIE